MKTKTPSIKIITITDSNSGQRIDNFLHTQLNNVPKSMIYRILRKGAVRVNKKRVKPKHKLEVGSKVRIPPLYMDELKKKNVLPYLQK